MQIEVQPFRNEGKAVVPSRCRQAFSHEITSEKVKQCAKLQLEIETVALLPSLLQGHTSIYRASCVFLEASSVSGLELGEGNPGLQTPDPRHCYRPTAFSKNSRVKNFSGPPSFFASASIRVAAMSDSIFSLEIDVEYNSAN